MKKSSEIAKKNKKKYEMKYYNSSFATILRDLLQKKEFNQQRLAEKLDVSRQTISLYANGNSLPDIETLKKIIKYFKENKFDYSSDYWLGLTDEPSVDVEIKSINKKYGLNAEALNTLIEIKKEGYINSINDFITNINDFIYLESFDLIREANKLFHFVLFFIVFTDNSISETDKINALKGYKVLLKKQYNIFLELAKRETSFDFFEFSFYEGLFDKCIKDFNEENFLQLSNFVDKLRKSIAIYINSIKYKIIDGIQKYYFDFDDNSFTILDFVFKGSMNDTVKKLIEEGEKDERKRDRKK